jgi:beta-lactamase class D
MHKGRTTEAWYVWKHIRGEEPEARKEFFVMMHSVAEELMVQQQGKATKRFVWMDFFTVPRARRAIIYANVMVSLDSSLVSTPVEYLRCFLSNYLEGREWLSI